MIESLKEKFGIDVLDVQTRTLAALYINDKIYIAKTHTAALRKYKGNEDFTKAEHATLHIILNKEKRIFFIEQNTILTNVSMEQVVAQIKKQYKKPFEIYAYMYKDKIRTLA